MGIRAFLLLVACLTVLSAPVHAEQNIGFVNPIQILSNSQEGKARISRWEASLKSRQDGLGAQEEEIRTLQLRFSQNAATMSAERRDDLRREIERKTTDLRRQTEDISVEAQREREKIVAEISARMTTLIQEYGRDNGFAAIFLRSPEQQVFVSDGFDVTPAILELYDQRHPAAQDTP